MIIERLLDATGIEERHLLWIADTASRRYKNYQIDKKSGGKREISHPARNVKAIQRWLNRVLFSKFPVHACATAYKKGSNIKKNAIMHKDSNFTLRLDYKDFFPSFDSAIIHDFLAQNHAKIGIELSEKDLEFICKIVTKEGRLTIGAPSSPIITNAIMYEFDTAANNLCQSSGLIYTRYADDIFISSTHPNKLTELEKNIAKITRGIFGDKLKINPSKSRYLSRKYRRSIAGIVITSDNKISLGRKRKREVRSLIYKYTQKQLDPVQLWRTRGLIAFCMDIEPHFIEALERKYGAETLKALNADKRVGSKKAISTLRRIRFPRKSANSQKAI